MLKLALLTLVLQINCAKDFKKIVKGIPVSYFQILIKMCHKNENSNAYLKVGRSRTAQKNSWN